MQPKDDFITPFEAELLVQDVKEVEVEQYGSSQ